MPRQTCAVLAAALLAVFLAAPAGAAVITVHVFDFDFSVNPPGQAIVDPTIKVGDTVRWQFDSGFHTSTSVAGIPEQWDSGFVSPGGTFSHAFTNVGTFEYYCQPHGFDQGNGRAGGMAGKVTVQPVPEPAAGMAAVSAMSLGLLRRRRRQ